MEEQLIFLEEEPSDTQKEQPQIKILIIDDDQMVHDSTVLALRNSKINDRIITLIHATSKQQAFSLIEQQLENINIIITDQIMDGEKDGYEIAEFVKIQKKLAIPIILRSGFTGTLSRPHINSFHIDSYLEKALISRDLLISTIQGLL